MGNTGRRLQGKRQKMSILFPVSSDTSNSSKRTAGSSIVGGGFKAAEPMKISSKPVEHAVYRTATI